MTTRVEVFGDVWCPFTHVGLRELVEQRRRLGRDDVRLVVRAWPLELVNQSALAPEFVADEIAQLRSIVAPEMFAGFRTDRWPTSTLAPLRLTHKAYLMGDETGEAVALELRDRLFERGEDISQPAVLGAVAQAHGITADPSDERSGRDVVAEEWAIGRERGVIGSPHFFAGGTDMFCPSLHIDNVDGHLRVEWDQTGFDRLLDACFG